MERASMILRLAGVGLLRLEGLQMFWPGEFHQHRHRDRRQDRIAGMIRQPNGQKPEEKRFGLLPVPKVLVQKINHNDHEGQQTGFGRFHREGLCPTQCSMSSLMMSRSYGWAHL